MLDWFTGTGRTEYDGFAEDSKLPEVPTTPGPVFAYRAFKNAVMGTPAVEAEEEDELTVPIKPLASSRSRINELPIKKPQEKRPVVEENQQLPPKIEPTAQPMASPTKSILLTPGTGVARRKTVSFGSGVVDNERKQPSPKTSPRKEVSGTISQQWTSNLASGTTRNKNKFMQSLLDAQRENLEQNDLFDISDKGHDTPSDKETTRDIEPGKPVSETSEPQVGGDVAEDDQEDVTTNLEMPRSQSGKYWKSEFESYKARTNAEIKKLIQYRSVAKSYAKKKEAEATRLAERLKREEDKIGEMERHVSKLAADMANGQDTDKEGLLKELSKQTALVLQYKQKVDSMRKTLEKHGVFENGGEIDADESNAVAEKLRETEEALKQANKKLQNSGRAAGMTDMGDSAAKSEGRAKELEKENEALKRNLTRVKREMLQYEDRRKQKEARLKDREQKLETRLHEYSTRLKESTARQKETEEQLKTSFAVEKKQLQETILALKQKVQGDDHDLDENRIPGRQYGHAARKNLNLDVYEDKDAESWEQAQSKSTHDVKPSILDQEDDDFELPLPTRTTVPRHNRVDDDPPHGNFEEQLISFEESLPKKFTSRGNNNIVNNVNYIPPSSPPLDDVESSPQISLPRHLTHATVPTRPHRPSLAYMGNSPRKSKKHPRRQGSAPTSGEADNPTKTPNVAADSTMPQLKQGILLPSTDSVGGSANANSETISPERRAAAEARLKKKQLNKERSMEAGKVDYLA